jgi:5-methylthioadenosine/S-adenosylhomocysteine deaminase
MQIDTLIHARWIIPVEPDGVVYERHALAINDGRIVDLLPSQEATTHYQAAANHNLDAHALIPGLINAHTHAAMSLFRGIADDLSLMDWLNHHVWPAEQQWVSPRFVHDGARLAIAEMLRGGVTCFSDMYYFPDQVAQAAVEAGMRAVVGLVLIDFPSAWANDIDEYFRKGAAVHDQFRGHELIRTAFAPHAPYTVDDRALEKVAVLAEELDIPIHMHVHETRHEIEESIDKHGTRPIRRLETLGLLTERLIAVHATQLEDDEIPLLAEHGVSVVHCPESNLKLASGFCPVHRLNRVGVNIAIGTDGAASNNDLDMFGEMRTAALLAKAVAREPRAVPARVALRMATIQAARALGLESITGSIRPDKDADITAVRLDTLNTEPVYDPISQIVYSAGRDHVTDVWVAGRHLVQDGNLSSIDESQLLAQSRQWREKIASASLSASKARRKAAAATPVPASMGGMPPAAE